MKPKKAAIFDLDGTLVDSMYVWSKVDEDFLTQRGIAVTQAYTDKMRSMFFETAAAYTKETYQLKESVEQIMQIWLDMAQEEYARHVRLKPYAGAYLRYLKEQGTMLGMATSNNPYLLLPCLSQNGLSGVMDCICYTSEVGVNKSNPDIYVYTAGKLGVEARDCVVFEDIIEGLRSAASVGMQTVAVYDASNEPYWKEICTVADRTIHSYQELLPSDRNNE